MTGFQFLSNILIMVYLLVLPKINPPLEPDPSSTPTKSTTFIQVIEALLFHPFIFFIFICITNLLRSTQ